MAQSKAVAKQKQEDKSLMVSPYGEEDIGAGFEGFTADDIAIPFINILQKLSHQVDEDDALHIDGAKAGMLFNTVTEELFDGKDGIMFIPVHRVHSYSEWVPRDMGGGFVAQHDPLDPVVLRE